MDIKFQRGLDPKVAMDIGGIDLEKLYNDTVKKPFRQGISWKKGYNKWIKYLDSLKGKKITFGLDINVYPQFNFPKKRTITLDNWWFSDNYKILYFMQSEKDKTFDNLYDNTQKWYVDMSQKIHVH